MKRKTQNEQILYHMLKVGKITTYISFVKYKCTNLPKRICELSKMGWSIKKGWKKTKTGQVRTYWL